MADLGSLTAYTRDLLFVRPVVTPAIFPIHVVRKVRYFDSMTPVDRGAQNERSRVARKVRIVSSELAGSGAVRMRSRVAPERLRRNQLPYAPLTNLTLDPTAQFAGTVLLNGVTPMFDCIVVVYDHESGMDAGRSAIAQADGAFLVVGLVPGRRYRLEVQNRVYNSTLRSVQIGIITA
jgi:hypothetical protein